MEKTIGRFVGGFLFAGIAMLAAAIFWANSVQGFIGRATAGRGVVIDLQPSRSSDSTTYHPVVKFRTAAGQERTFRSSSGSSPPDHAVGESVEVLYDAADPTSARIRSFFSLWGGPTIFGALGAVFFLVGGGVWLARRSSAARAQELRRHGTPIETVFQDVERNRALEINGRNPWRVVTQWKDPASGELHLFHSENLWFDPTTHIATKDITVYVDRRNPKRYHMDVSFLPALAGSRRRSGT